MSTNAHRWSIRRGSFPAYEPARPRPSWPRVLRPEQHAVRKIFNAGVLKVVLLPCRTQPGLQEPAVGVERQLRMELGYAAARGRVLDR
jgi:hypothetical protein